MKLSRSHLRQMIREVMADLEEDAIFSKPDILGLQPERDIPGQEKGPYATDDPLGRNLSHGDPKAGDHEGRMTRGQLDKIARYAQSLHDMIRDNDDLPEWIQSKIAVIDHDIGKVKHYLEYKIKRMKR